MKMTVTATIEEFDKEAYGAAVAEEMRRVFLKAGQKFLLAAIPRIPIWTGMARGAFRNLEDLVGKVTNDAQSGGVRIRTTTGRGSGKRGGGKIINKDFRRGYYYTPPGGSKIERTPQAGRAFSTDSSDILDLKGATLASGRTSFYFRYDVNITYVDSFEAKWGAFKAGEAALTEYLNANLKLPDPLKYMIRKQTRNS